MPTGLNIVNATQLGTLVVPGVYTAEPPPSPTGVTGPATNTLGDVGTASYGPVNTPQTVSAAGSRASTTAAVQAVYGRATADNRSLVDAIANGAAPEANLLVLNRVTDGTDTAAVFSITDATGFAAGTLTGGGTFAAGVALTFTLTNGAVSVPIAYTSQSSDVNIAGVMASLLKLINASAAVVGSLAFLQPATLAGSVISYKALASGTGGNSIGTTATGTGLTLTPSGATLTGGAAPGVVLTLTALYTGSAANSTTSQFVGGRIDYKSASNSTSPTFRASLYAFNGTVEIFDNIIGYATAGSGLSVATLQTNLIAAINVGTSSRAPSQFWVATVGSSTSAPLTGVQFPAAGGTDGATGVTLTTQFGQDGTTGRTGLYSLRGLLQGGTVMIAGMGNSASDVALVQTLDAFCQQEACIGIFACGPAGTTPTAAVTTLQTYAAQTRFTLPMLGEPYFVDPNSGLSQLENPIGAAAGIISSLNPWVSPLNKPKIGIIATEWSVGQFPDETAMQSNGIGYFKYIGGSWVFYGKTTGNGTPIEDVRMLNYLAPIFTQIGATFVGKGQPAVVNNPRMTAYANAIKAFLTPIAATVNGQNTGNANPKITTYEVDLSPNTVSTIQGHNLIAAINVQTLSSIWYVLNILQVGNGVQVTPAG